MKTRQGLARIALLEQAKRRLIRTGRFNVQRERLLRAAIFVSRLRDSNSRAHAYNLRAAQKIIDIMGNFIAEEVQEAVKENDTDPAHLSWVEIGQCLNLSKSAAYARYGKK